MGKGYEQKRKCKYYQKDVKRYLILPPIKKMQSKTRNIRLSMPNIKCWLKKIKKREKEREPGTFSHTA